MECRSANSFRRYRHFYLAVKPYYKCVGEKKFRTVSCRGQEVRTVAQKSSEVEIQFIPLAFETFGGFSETFHKILKRIATLADNRSFQPAGLSVAFSKLSQSFSVTAIWGSAIMLLAREARL